MREIIVLLIGFIIIVLINIFAGILQKKEEQENFKNDYEKPKQKKNKRKIKFIPIKAIHNSIAFMFIYINIKNS